MIPILLAKPIAFATMQLVAVSAARSTPAGDVDSVRVLRAARAAQSRFESTRRMNLPIERGGSGGRCDVRVGRFCYWVDDGEEEEKRPEEPRRIRDARGRLLDTLDSAIAMLPGDGWIAGQRVRYLMETGDTARTIAAANACDGDEGWCAALAGLALHWSGRYASADSAFDLALAALPAKDRCRWLDLERVAEGDLADRIGHTPCEKRDTLVSRLFWLSRPLFLTGANDLRTEHLARVVRSRIEEHSKSAQALGWGSDVDELMVRYGWPIWYARTAPAPGSLVEPSIVGHDPWPGFTFFPDLRSLDSATRTPADAWELRRRVGRSRYAPAYARAFHALPHQLAVFRRGDSALVVAAYDVSADTLLRGQLLRGGVFLTSAPGEVVGTAAETPDRGVLRAVAPWHPMLASVELLSTGRRAAARARYGVTLPDRSGRMSVSDLLLFTPSDSTVSVLDDALRHALTSERVRRDRPLGLFWETYGLDDGGEALGISLTIEEVGASWTRRLARSLRLAGKGSPLRVRWVEQPDRRTRIASRAVTVDLSRLAPGRYRIRLEATPPGESGAGAGTVGVVREVQVVRE